jgi:hypothetical protein
MLLKESAIFLRKSNKMKKISRILQLKRGKMSTITCLGAVFKMLLSKKNLQEG